MFLCNQDEDKAKAESASSEVVEDQGKLEIKSNREKSLLPDNPPMMVPCNSNSIGRTSINSASGLR